MSLYSRVSNKIRRAVSGSEALLTLPPPMGGMRIPYGSEPEQHGELYLPKRKAPHPVVIIIHGGFWRAEYNLEHIRWLCAALCRNGFAVWSIEYRRIGQKSGGYPGTLMDVGAAVDHIKKISVEYQLDMKRIVTVGHSAGGHLGFWVAARRNIPDWSPLAAKDPLRLSGAISLAGVLDLNRASELFLGGGVTDKFMGCRPQECPERYAEASPIQLLPFRVRQYLVHGMRDTIVPIELSERHYEAARGKGDPVDFVALQGIGHFELIDPESSAWSTVLRLVREALEVPA